MDYSYTFPSPAPLGRVYTFDACVCVFVRVSLNPFGNWRIPRTQMPINSTARRRWRCGGGRYIRARCDIQFITHPHTISSSTDLRRRVLNRWIVCVCVCVVYNAIIIIIIIIITIAAAVHIVVINTIACVCVSVCV